MREAILAAVLAGVTLGLGTPIARADERQAGASQVTVGTFYSQESGAPETIDDAFCFEGLVGTVTGTLTSSGRFNSAPGFFHAEGTQSFDSRVVYPDGRYVLGRFDAIFSFTANVQTGVPLDNSTNASTGSATVYAADGTPIGSVAERGTFHVSYTDLNGNFEAEPGEIKTWVDRVKVSCT